MAGRAKGSVSIQVEAGSWLLRWRQDEEQPDGSVKRVRKGHRVYSEGEALRVKAEIVEALRSEGYWLAPTVGSAPAVGNAEEVALAWLRWKVEVKAVARATQGNLARSMGRFFKALRAVLKLGPRDVVPATALTSANVGHAVGRLRKRGYADGTIYQTIAAVMEMWTWAADPEDGFDVPPPPRNLDRVMPRAPLYSAPDMEPTFAECDACIRRIGRRSRGVRPLDALRIAVFMRYTGLRVEQVALLRREDVDVAGRTITVRKGKSRREQSMRRTVPVSAHLFEDLGGWLATVSGGPLFPDSTDPTVPVRSYRNQTTYVRQAWEAATREGEARREAWAPPNRKKARPDHAFRAAFQAGLEAEGVAESTLDRLVGHAPQGTRRKHYANVPDVVLRRAVELVPPIDWCDAAAHPSEGTALRLVEGA